MRNSSTSTQQSLLEGRLQKLNSDVFFRATLEAGRRLLVTLYRRHLADIEFRRQYEDAINNGNVKAGDVTNTELQIYATNLINNAAASADAASVETMNKSLKAGPFLHRVAAFVALFEARFMPLKQPHQTRSSVSSAEESQQLRELWRDLGPKPRQLKKPVSFTFYEFNGLLNDYKEVLYRLLNDARPELKLANESSLEFLGRIASYLRALHAKYHNLSGILRRDQTQVDKRKLQEEKSAVVRAIAAVLESASAHAKLTSVKDVKDFRWPDAAAFCRAESPIDVLPPHLFYGRVFNSTNDRHIARLALLFAKAQRRMEDVTQARDAVYSLVPNFRHAIDTSKAFVSKAKEMLRRLHVYEDDVEGLLAHTGLLCSGPFSAQRPFVQDGRITPTVEACLLSLVMRSESFVAVASKLQAMAERLNNAAKLLLDEVVPIKDARQIYASRYLQQLLEGKLSPEEFAAKVTTGKEVPAPARVNRRVWFAGDGDEGSDDGDVVHVEDADEVGDDDEGGEHDEGGELEEDDFDEEDSGDDNMSIEASNQRSQAADEPISDDIGISGIVGPGEAANAADRGGVEPIGGQAADAADSVDNQAAHAANRKRKHSE